MSPETLERRHFLEWGEAFVPDEAIGFVLRDGSGEMQAIAAVCFVAEPADLAMPAGWWAFFDSRGRVSPLAHRYAVKVRNALEASGADCVYAEADQAVPRAEEWLLRLGFRPWRGELWRLQFGVARRGGFSSGDGIRRCVAGNGGRAG